MKLKSLGYKFSKFSIVGVFNTFFNIFMFNIFMFIGMTALSSNFLSLTISIVISYFLNSYYVFSIGTYDKSTFIKFFVYTSVIQILIQHISIIMATRFLNVNAGYMSLANFGKIIGVIFSLGISFAVYDRVIFKEKSVDNI